MKIYLLILSCAVSLFSIRSLQAARVDIVTTYSPSMDKEIKAVVITPENYSTGKEFPVVYLLHGAMANYAELIKQAPALRNYADLYNFIIVFPDGNYASWYFDSPVNPESKYETYISTELLTGVDKNYRTIKNRSGRAITGISMGGMGLYTLHSSTRILGSMSGAVDLRPFAGKFGIPQQLGPYIEHPERWEQNTVINMLYMLTSDSLSLIIDCGTEDFFSEVNQHLHEKLLARTVPHDYDYFRNAVKYQMLYMNNFFGENY